MKDQTVIYKSYDNMYKAMYESFLSEDSTLPLDPTLMGKTWGIKLYVFEKDIPTIDRLLAELNNEK